MIENPKFAKTAALNQYYRDMLTQSLALPKRVNLPEDLMDWVCKRGNVDTIQLAERLLSLPTRSTSKEDLALQLMLFTILQSNFFLYQHEGYQSVALINTIKSGLHRILELHPHPSYMENAVLLLFRMNLVDDAVDFAQRYAFIIEKSPFMQSLLGFIYTHEKNWQKAGTYIAPLLAHPELKNLPLLDLTAMTWQYFSGEIPQWPVHFGSLNQSADVDFDGILPPLKLEQRAQPYKDNPIAIIACDSKYFFEHGLPLAYSVASTNAEKIALHFHLYMPNASVIEALKLLQKRLPEISIGYSLEDGEPPGEKPVVYYSCVRFIRAYQLLQHYNHPIILMDADALFQNSWDNFLPQRLKDLALVASNNAPFWEEIMAGFLYAKPTSAAKNYLGHVASFIFENFKSKTTRWFLDQIALSACRAHFLKSSTDVSYLAPEEAMDTTHGNDALTWAVTINKNSHKRYNKSRDKLLSKYKQNCHFSRKEVFDFISKEPVFFLQIGAMNGVSYDPIHRAVTTYEWRGILVEPLPDMMVQLKENYRHQKNLSFENIAITEKAESKTLYHIPYNVAKQAGLPEWVCGMSSFLPHKLSAYKDYVVQVEVPCTSLQELLDKHKPAVIDVLQIDAEGYDYIIFKQFDFDRYAPKVVTLEVENLSLEDRKIVEKTLHKHGYLFYKDDLDVFAVRKDVLFKN